MLAIVCPGQGSQAPGFLGPWLDQPGLTERVEGLSEVAGVDLVRHGTVSDAETIKDTAVAQPLIVAAGLIALEALGGVPDGAVVAGHSVGEVTAAAAAGVLTAEEAVGFVSERGRSMAAASAATPTGMAAVVGGDPDEVAAVLERHGLTAANNNGGGQVVAAGTRLQLDALAKDPPSRARVIPLQVAGAFHTSHMAPAVATLDRYAAGIAPGKPTHPLLSNRDGAVVDSGEEFLARLVSQVSSPVRWDLCTQTLAGLGVTALVELPPAGTLAGLAKRALRGVEILPLRSPADLAEAARLAAAHG